MTRLQTAYAGRCGTSRAKFAPHRACVLSCLVDVNHVGLLDLARICSYSQRPAARSALGRATRTRARAPVRGVARSDQRSSGGEVDARTSKGLLERRRSPQLSRPGTIRGETRQFQRHRGRVFGSELPTKISLLAFRRSAGYPHPQSPDQAPRIIKFHRQFHVTHHCFRSYLSPYQPNLVINGIRSHKISRCGSQNTPSTISGAINGSVIEQSDIGRSGIDETLHLPKYRDIPNCER